MRDIVRVPQKGDELVGGEIRIFLPCWFPSLLLVHHVPIGCSINALLFSYHGTLPESSTVSHQVSIPDPMQITSHHLTA